MFELLLARVGLAITKHLLSAWLGEGITSTIGGELIDVLAQKFGQDGTKKAERQIESIRNGVVRDLEPYFVTESLGDASIERIVEALGQTLNAAEASAHLVKGRFDPSAVAQEFAVAAPNTRAALDPAERELYDRALQATAASLVRIAEELPDFQKTVAEEQLRQLDQIANNVGTILETIRPLANGIGKIDDSLKALHDRPALEADAYDSRFRQGQQKQVGVLRLLGLPSQDHEGSEFDLDIAYIPLHLNIANHDFLLSFSYPELLAILPYLGNRLLIEGPAGCGKTTLLQWTALAALQAANSVRRPVSARAVVGDLRRRLAHPRFQNPTPERFFPALKPLFQPMEDSQEIGDSSVWRIDFSRESELPELLDARPWWGLLPFFIRLRDCPEGRLPKLNHLPEMIAKWAGSPPPDWMHKKLKAGEALLLIDGIDEIPADARAQLRRDLDEFAAAYPKTPLIVTSRPSAAREWYWAKFFEHRLVVEPMMHDEIRAFISQWHKALAERTSEPAADAAALSDQVLSTPALFQLAQTPLLCAAICYLDHEEKRKLPRRTVQLYEALCRQLVQQLDIERLKQDAYEKLVPALAGLEALDKLSLLARLALAMIRDERSTLPIELGSRVVKEGLAALGKCNRPEKVLTAL